MGGLFGRMGGKHQHAPELSGVNIQSSAYGLPIPIVYGQNRISGNIIWYGDFAATAHNQSGKGGNGQGATTYTYQAALAIGICEGPINGIGAVWKGSTQTTLSSLGFSVTYLGGYTQTPWGYLTTNHAGQDLTYRGLAYVGHSSYQLDSTAQLPNLNFEVQGLFQYGGGIVDANPKDVLNDFLTNTDYGAMWPAAKLGGLTQFSNYCVANGIFISPAITAQKPAHDFITALMKMTNSECFYSEGVLKVVPYGDQTVTGNGVTYTPNVTSLYDLTDTDFEGGKKDPVKCTRSTPADAYNQVTVEFHDRTTNPSTGLSNAYKIATATATDQANVELYGLLPMPVIQLHEVCDPGIARIIAQLILQRTLYVRNTYEFKLGWRYCLLEPMDIVTLTDAGLGLGKAPVRITKIEEDQNGVLTVTAEEYPAAVSTHSVYGSQSGGGYSANYEASAGNVNTPIIFEAPVEIAESGLEVWMALSGGSLYGGADVYISADGNTYNFAGRVWGRARMGVLTATLPVSADPDNVDTLAVDLTESTGTLTSASSNAVLPLCYVDGEFVSFLTATLTAANKYNLTTLRRGLYESAIGSHAAGAAFARLDQMIFKYPYTKAQIGSAIYVKCCSFNIYGGGLQSLASVPAFTHVIQGPPLPENVTGFSAQQNGGTVVFQWNEIASYALKGYDIRVGPQGTTNWSNMTPLTESSRGTEMTNAGVPPGTWTFAIRARDLADQLSATMATANLSVVNQNPTVLADTEEPAWLGTSTGFYAHWTGVLVPLGTKTCNNYTAWEDFNNFVPDPVAQSIYTSPTLDMGFNDTLRVWFNAAPVLGPGQTNITANLTTYLDSWLTGAADPNTYNPWSLGSLSVRYIKGRLVLNNTAGSMFYIKTFDITADRAPKIENSGNLVVPAGGVGVTFPTPYHLPPNVQLTVIGASALIGTAVNITATGFTAHVWNSSGTDVGGTVNWQSTGE